MIVLAGGLYIVVGFLIAVGFLFRDTRRGGSGGSVVFLVACLAAWPLVVLLWLVEAFRSGSDD